MQIKPNQLTRQQVIMAHLGLYKHKVDGIWGPASIAAKCKWEEAKTFIPAFPNGGLPLGDRDKLPRGMLFDRKTRLLTLDSMKQEEYDRHEKSVVVKPKVEEKLPVIGAPGEVKKEEKPLSPVETEAPKNEIAAPAEVVAEEKPADNQQKSFHNKNKKHQKR